MVWLSQARWHEAEVGAILTTYDLTMEQRNRLLTAEVLALRSGHDAVEARARKDLGMVKEGETFFLVPEQEW